MADITKEKEIVVADGLGDATPDNVLAGTTFSSETGFKQEGKFVPSAGNISYDNTKSGLIAENTQEAIDEVRDELMITGTATGERITVNNSADASVREFKVDGKTEQFTTTGKNLCSGYKVGAYKNSDGVYARDYADYRCTELIEVSEGINYVESNGLGMNVSDVHHFDENKKWLSSIASKNINNRPSGTKYIALNYLTSDDLKWVQVEENTVATEYEPYTNGASPNPDYPQDIKGVGDSGEVEVTVTGKNLLKNTAISTTSYGVQFTVFNDGSILAKGTPTQHCYLPINTFEYGDGKYILSGCPKGGSESGFTLYDDTLKKYDTGNGIEIDGNQSGKIYIRILSGTPLNDVVFKPMIRKAEIEDNVYEPYKSQTITLSDVPTLYECDSVTLKNGKLEVYRENKKVVFDGSDDEGWYPSTKATSGYMYGVRILDAKYAQNDANPNNVQGYCSHFIMVKSYNEAASKGSGYCGFGTYTSGNITTTSLGLVTNFTTTAEWKTYLAENPITVVYRLAEPTVETIDTDIDLSTYNHVTNITNSDNANMEVEYFVNNRHADMVTELREDIENMNNELNDYKSEVTANFINTRTQINAKAPLKSPKFTGDVTTTDAGGNTVSLLSLKNYVTTKTFEINSVDNVQPTDRYNVAIDISIDGYIPVMATYLEYSLNPIYDKLHILQSEGKWIIDVSIFNIGEYSCIAIGEVTVLYVRNI